MSTFLAALTADGKVRVWVETLVLTESLSLGQPSSEAGSTTTPPRGPARLSQQSMRSPGSGSPGAAPSSPRDVRAAAAAAAALGTAAPAITSYFCMALLIDPTAPAGGAPAVRPPTGSGQPGGSDEQSPAAHVALWARHAGPLLLHKQQRRVAAPVLWLFTASVQPKPVDGSYRLRLQLHAVRGLAAIVMSAGYGGSLSSTSGASTSTRPAAVLWGQHHWDVPAAAAASCPAQLLQRLCCWVSEEEGFPLLHAFTSSSGSGGSLLLAGRTFSTVEDGSANHLQVCLRAWHGAGLRCGGQSKGCLRRVTKPCLLLCCFAATAYSSHSPFYCVLPLPCSYFPYRCTSSWPWQAPGRLPQRRTSRRLLQ